MVGSFVPPRRTILFLCPELGDLHFPPDGVLFVAPEDCFSPGVVAAVDFFSVDPAAGSAGGGCGGSDAGGGLCVCWSGAGGADWRGVLGCGCGGCGLSRAW